MSGRKKRKQFTKKVAREIAAAIIEGFDDTVIRVERSGDMTLIYTEGWETSPVVISTEGVTIPVDFSAEIVAGIHLDVRTILAYA